MAKRHNRASSSGSDNAVSTAVRPGETLNLALLEHIENEWLGLGDTSLIPTGNIFDPRSIEDIENPVLHILSLMRTPEYFYFTCKHFLNREIMPLQCCILSEFWRRPFPSLYGSRGLGKTFVLGVYIMLRLLLNPGVKVVVVGAAFRQSKFVFDVCLNIWNSSPILKDIAGPGSGPRFENDRCSLRFGDSMAIFLPTGDGCLSQTTMVTYEDRFGTIADDAGEEYSITPRERGVWGNKKFNLSDEAYNNGFRQTKKITTKRGFQIEGTHNHKIKILRDYDIVWERFDNLKVGDNVLVDRKPRWHNGDNHKTEAEAYSLGLMIGDGCWTSPTTLRYATADQELIDAVRIGTGYDFKPVLLDKFHYNNYGKEDKRKWMKKWGLSKCYAHEKSIPATMMSATKPVMAALIRGIYDTDGNMRADKKYGGGAVCLTSTSEKLMRQIQFILTHFGIVASLSSRQRNNANWRRVYEMRISGTDTEIFAKEIGFGLTRKQKSLLKSISNRVRNKTIMGGVPGIAEKLLTVSPPGKAGAKSKSINKSTLKSRKRITHEAILDFITYYNCDDELSAKLKILSNPDIYYDTITDIEDGECETFDIHVPEGHEYCANGLFSHNSKIRGERAGILIADELSAQRVDIFENVVSGFAAVSMDPIAKVKAAGRERARKARGLFTADDDLPAVPGLNSNQTILAGTCYYTFNHSYDYWKRYRDIINSKGDKHTLNEIFNGDIPAKFDWRDYCIMRIPWDLLPPDYMDAKHIAKAKNTLHKSQFSMEYSAVFSGDSDGFFQRSLVEQCVVGGQDSNIRFPSTGNEPVYFSAALRGDMQRQYVIAVDPASESDNFAVVVLELWPDHRRIVYCWTTTRKRHKARLAKNAVKEHDFFQYVARKIRDLCVLFPCARLCVDKLGGGISVMEALGDPERLLEGEVPILPIIEEGVDKPTDRTPGDHILELVYFAKADWVSNANNGLKFDLESKLLLFPAFDAASVGLAMEEDRLMGRIVVTEDGTEEVLYDTLEDCVMNIEEIKEELASIVHSQTGVAGRDHWDTPKARDMLGKETRTRKDRYSALLMANMAARTMTFVQARPQYYSTGGFATDLRGAPQQPKGHFNPPGYTQRVGDGHYGAIVPRRR